MNANKKYKDSVFTTLFSKKDKLIELFNAIEGTDYTIDTDLEINTLENILYMDRYNDISFLLDGRFIVLMEHQSSINQNMPLRIFLYIARVYEKIIDNKSIYREKMIKIPSPEFIVLYNGNKNQPEKQISKLSDAFKEPSDALELKIRCININYGKSTKLLEKSKTLQDYSYFIYQVNRYKEQGNQIEDSICFAIKDCVEHDILKDFLQEHGSEVVNMLYTEFNLEDAKEVWKEEAREEGLREGKKEGLEEGLREGKKEGLEEGERKGKKKGLEEGERKGVLMVAVSLLGILEDRVIAEKTGLTLEEIEQLRRNEGNK